MFNTANGDRPGVPNVVIFITDGVSNLNSERTIPETLLTHAAGIHVFVVGIGLTGETLEIKVRSHFFFSFFLLTFSLSYLLHFHFFPGKISFLTPSG